MSANLSQRFRIARTLLSLAAVVILGLLSLVGSGGGGEDPPSPPAALVQATVTLDNSVPAAAQARIASYTATTDAKPTGQALGLSFNTKSGRAVVLALDDSEQPLLIAIAASANVVMSAESTALALASLLLGGPNGVTSDVFEAQLRSTTHFIGLRDAIQAALATHASPLTQPAVLQQAQFVLTEYATASSSNSAAPTHNSRRKLASTQVTTVELPFPVVPDTFLGGLPVSIVGLCGDRLAFRCVVGGGGPSAIAVANTTPIPWEAQTYTTDGVPVSEPTLLVPTQYSVAQWVGSWAVSPLTTTSPYGLSNDGKTVNLTVRQSPVARKKALGEALWQTISMLLQYAPVPDNPSCTEKVVELGLKAFVDAKESLDPTLPKFTEILDSFLSDLRSPDTVDSILGACSKDYLRTSFSQVNRAVLELTKKLLPLTGSIPASVAIELYKASQLLARFAYLDHFWNKKDQTVAVCIDKNGRIANCTAKFETSPSIVRVTKGVDVSRLVTVTAKDAAGLDTIEPIGLRYLSDAAPTYIALDEATGAARSIAEVLTQVRINDPATGASGIYVVNVMAPAIKPRVATLRVGEKLKLAIADVDGFPLVVAPGSRWTSRHTSVADIDILASLLTSCGETSCVVVAGKAAGVAAIDFALGGDASYGSASAEIQVVENEINLAITPANLELLPQQVGQLTASARDLSGNQVALPAGLVWASSNPAIATVTSGGLVTAHSVGSTLITVTDPVTQTEASASVQVAAAGAHYAYTFSAGGVPCGGSTGTATATVSGNNQSFTYNQSVGPTPQCVFGQPGSYGSNVRRVAIPLTPGATYTATLCAQLPSIPGVSASFSIEVFNASGIPVAPPPLGLNVGRDTLGGCNTRTFVARTLP